MTGSEMAAQLEKVAEGARNGNGACIAAAREMLAARRMLEMLAARRMLEALDGIGSFAEMMVDEFSEDLATHTSSDDAREHAESQRARWQAVIAAIAAVKGEGA